MPIVDVYYEKRRILRKHRTALESVLYDVLPKQLTCTDDAGKPIDVTSAMVKIHFVKGSRRDTHTKDIELRVFVRDFKSRSPHYQRYADELQEAVGKCLSAGLTISVSYIRIAAWAAGVATGAGREDE